MKLWLKILIGVIAIILILAIISNIGKDKTTDLEEQESTTESSSSTTAPVLPSTPGNTLDELQSELNTLETQINNLESEDLAGLE